MVSRAGVLAWGLLATFVALEAVVVLLVLFRGGSPDELFSLVTVVYAVAGAVVAARRPRTPIGWLLLLVALAFALQSVGETYVADLDHAGAAYVGWVGSLTWHVWLAAAAVFLPLVFPTGRLPSPRWRPVAWLAAGAVVLNVAVTALRPGDLGLSAPVDNPFGWSTQATLLKALEALGIGLSVLSVALAAAAIGARFRHSRGVERQQLKWFALVALVGGVGLVGAFLATVLPGGWRDPFGALGWGVFLLSILVGLPVTVAVAVLRHRLLDIDLVIKRTLVYGSLSVLLVIAYLVVVLVARFAVSPVTSDSDLAVAASTLTVAALFRPLRARVQALVDRRFYRARYDASRALDEFSTSLREQLDLDALGSDLRRVVRDAMAPAHVSLWVREDAR